MPGGRGRIPGYDLRILHIIASVDPSSGGPIEGILRQEKVTGGVDGRVVREIVSLDLPDAPFLKSFPIAVHALGRPIVGNDPVRRLQRHYRYSPDYAPWIRANAHRFDCAIVHGLWNYSALAAAWTLPGSGLPYFVFTHGMLDPWFRAYYPKKHVAKQLSWLIAEGRLLAHARSVLFTCAEEQRQAEGAFRGYSYTGTVVGYGTTRPPAVSESGRAALAEIVPDAGDRPYLLFLSRIHAKKGCDLLIEGFARMADRRPELRLVMVGPSEPTLLAELQAIVARHGLEDRVIWPGPVFGDAKWALIAAAEAFILPSHQENFGIAVAEALAGGTPVLISDKVNIWQEIADAGAGLVAPDTVDGVIDLLARWFATPDAARIAMGQAGLDLFARQFDVANTAPALLDRMAAFIDDDECRPRSEKVRE